MNKISLVRIISIALIFPFIQCATGEFSKDNIQNYLLDEKNGLSKHAEVKGTRIEITYKPTDLLVEQEIVNSPVSVMTIDSLRNKYNHYHYFALSFSKNGNDVLHHAGAMAGYSELLQTMSFRMPQYITLTTAEQDTIYLADYILDRTYGMSSATNLLFVFERDNAAESDWIQFNLNEFGLGIGNQRFRFRMKDLEKVPELNLTKY